MSPQSLNPQDIAFSFLSILFEGLPFVLLGTVLLFPLALFIIGRWTASGYSYTGLFKPLAAVALAAIILGEPIRLIFVLGGALILVGVWVGAFNAQSVPSAPSLVIEARPTLILAPAIADDGVAR